MFSWGEKEQEAFLAMKEACTTVPVLGYPDYFITIHPTHR